MTKAANEDVEKAVKESAEKLRKLVADAFRMFEPLPEKKKPQCFKPNRRPK